MPVRMRLLLSAWLLILTAACPVWAATEAPPPAVLAPPDHPEALPRILKEGADALKEKYKTLRDRDAEARQELEKAQGELEALTVSISSLKAALAIRQLPLPEIQALQSQYGTQRAKVDGQIATTSEQAEALRAEQAAQAAARANLEAQIKTLREVRKTGEWFQEIARTYEMYLNLASAQELWTGNLVDKLSEKLNVYQQEKQLLDDIGGQLKGLEEAWRVELLKRQERVPLTVQLSRNWAALATVPERVQQWAYDLVRSGRLALFLKDNAGRLFGLIFFISLTGWATRVLRRTLTPRLKALQAEVEDARLVPLLRLTRLMLPFLFPVGFVIWLAAALRILGIMGSPAARSALYAMAALVALRLLFRLIQEIFGDGTKPGRLLSLDGPTGRFYRRSLKLLSAYILLGYLGLFLMDQLGFQMMSQTAEHFFHLGILLGTLWLLRHQPLKRLLDALPGSACAQWSGIIQLARLLVLLAFLVAVLSELLGFHSLSVFIAQSAVPTEGVLLLWALAMVIGLGSLQMLFHPERSFLYFRYPDQIELFNRLFCLSQRACMVVLSAFGLVAALWLWGITPSRLWAVLMRLNQGISLGSVRLAPVNVALTVLVVYLVLWASRFSRTFLQSRIFPKTGWDLGIQYTISTILQYIILIVGGILALNVLGFPLANLALLAGALGVGVGLGLQNIVSNFVSGLILLIERPVKVGDMLVIDGQWGEIKEIRMRSTVFQTFDRCVLIIPNSDLTANKILNWTHFGRGPSRIKLAVGVSYDADVKKVTELLRTVCQANERVLDTPAPQVYFEAYGDSSLNFTIMVFVRAPDDRVPALHEINTAIFETFQAHGIEIPFPQRDLHIRSLPENGTIEIRKEGKTREG